MEYLHEVNNQQHYYCVLGTEVGISKGGLILCFVSKKG